PTNLIDKLMYHTSRPIAARADGHILLVNLI
ncbi:hypothetical protein HKBW3S25_01735, partial [Candidatus Hakubella thermalkaliphila]